MTMIHVTTQVCVPTGLIVMTPAGSTRTDFHHTHISHPHLDSLRLVGVAPLPRLCLLRLYFS